MDTNTSSGSTRNSASPSPALAAVTAHLAASSATKEKLSTAAVRGRVAQNPGYALLTRLAAS